MTEAEFDRWLKGILKGTRTDRKNAFPGWDTRGHKHTRGEGSRVAEIRCHSQRKGNLARRLIFKTCRNAGLFLFGKIQHINSKAKQSRGFLGC